MVYSHPDQPRTRTKDYGTFKMSLADGYPLLLCLTESLKKLETDSGMNFQMERFRPNIVVDGGNPFEELEWKNVTVGNLTFKHLKPCVPVSYTHLTLPTIYSV